LSAVQGSFKDSWTVFIFYCLPHIEIIPQIWSYHQAASGFSSDDLKLLARKHGHFKAIGHVSDT